MSFVSWGGRWRGVIRNEECKFIFEVEVEVELDLDLELGRI